MLAPSRHADECFPCVNGAGIPRHPAVEQLSRPANDCASDVEAALLIALSWCSNSITSLPGVVGTHLQKVAN